MWYWKYVPPWAQRHYCYVGKIDDQIVGYFGAVPLRGMKEGVEIRQNCSPPQAWSHGMLNNGCMTQEIT